MSSPLPLPLVGTPPPERRDAARNREALLRAAKELLDCNDARAVTMDAVAARAGVGKGTVFRRFGSREGLMASLLDHEEAELQGAVLSGPPPLGPGAPPLARLLAYGEARMRTHLQQAVLIEEAGRTWGNNYAVTGFATMHVRYLLGQLDVPGDRGYLASALLAPLAVPVLRQQLDAEGMSEERILRGWRELVGRSVGLNPRGDAAGRS